MNFSTKKTAAIGVCSLATLAVGCGVNPTSQGAGSVSILLEPESTILDGLQPGDEIEQVRDGWSVTFDKYLLGVGHIQTHLGSNHDAEAEADTAFIVDLKTLPADGESLWEIDGLSPGRWTFGYEFVPGADSKRHSGVDKADYDRMKNEGLTHLITGTLSKSNGVSCPPSGLVVPPETEPEGTNSTGDKCYPNTSITFEISARAETLVSNCEQDGLPGFVIADSRQSAVAITVHGDHLFFNGFPEGGEGGIVRLAQIWADADLNLDGRLSVSEYSDILLADMGEWDERYQKGGAPLDKLETLGDLAMGQLKTQGHMDGEGECSVDGVTHEHADD